MGIQKDDGSDKKAGDKFEDLVDRAAQGGANRKPGQQPQKDDEGEEIDLDDDTDGDDEEDDE